MARLIDEILVNDLEASSLNDMFPADKVEEPKVEEVIESKPEEVVPEKYRGKSLTDIVSMHQEAEKLIGRQGSEVGELRKMVDDFIKTQTSKKSETEETDTEGAFFMDPELAVNRAIANHPAIKEAQQGTLLMKKQQTLSQIQSEFPNALEIVQDKNFQEWIGTSKVRTELFNRAENQFDYDSAQELLSTWTEKQNITKKVAETSKIDRDQQLKAADVGSNGATESVAKKKYRRSDIMELMKRDPKRYDAMSNEIMEAYREKRVI